MKRSILILTFLFPFIVSAQKLLKPNIDKISGDTTWLTSKEKLYLHGNYLTGQGEGVLCWVEKSKGIKVLGLNPQTVNQRDVFSIPKGQKAYLKLGDNTTITLNSLTSDIGNSHVGIAGDYVISGGSAIGFYVLTDEAVQKIKANPVVFVRIETSTGNFDCDIKSKNAELIKKQLELIENAK